MSLEQPPVNEYIHVIAWKDIYKTDKWWCAVIKANVAGHGRVLYYLWQKDRHGKWKRKHKASINSSKNWDAMKSIIEKYVIELGI